MTDEWPAPAERPEDLHVTAEWEREKAGLEITPRGLTFTGKLTDEQFAEFRKAFERARLHPRPLLINGQLELRPRRWWQRLWRRR